MNKQRENGRWPYEDIVDLPHHVSTRRSPMPMEKRAAQFAPFAALTGYNDAVTEAARLTDDRVELTEEAMGELDRKVREAMAEDREIRIVYYVPDDRKAGGAYHDATGRIQKVRGGEIVMERGERIPLRNIIEIV
ncbi:MAG: hypothetical protein IJX90_12020 [Blautia sp.]|nr:hypothetical protein [Blautia sp.]